VHAAEQAETTADWMLHRVRAARGRLWDEGPWRRPLADIDGSAAALRIFATRRVRGVSPAIARGLCAWARGQRPVDLLRHAPAPATVLKLQAAGRRCVSLLDDAAAHARGDRLHPDGLSFALHDLHHLEKFVEPQHHAGQVGFFRCMRRALADAEFVALQRTFDDTWIADRNYVIADMNGSAVFLFATLKMRVAMRRRVAAAAGQPAPLGGPLDAEERRALAPALETLFSAMGLPDALGGEARVVSANRAFPDHARRLLLHFEAAGA
jgi:hypothetical protein